MEGDLDLGGNRGGLEGKGGGGRSLTAFKLCDKETLLLLLGCKGGGVVAVRLCDDEALLLLLGCTGGGIIR